jgi:hypothetical protein
VGDPGILFTANMQIATPATDYYHYFYSGHFSAIKAVSWNGSNFAETSYSPIRNTWEHYLEFKKSDTASTGKFTFDVS